MVTCSASSITGINNFGDELLTDLYGSWISECGVDVEVHHASVSQFGRLSPESKRAIDQASLLVFTGGGYFSDGDGHPIKTFLRALRNRAVYRSVFKRSRRRGLPVAVMGLEVGPLANPLYRGLVGDIVRNSGAIVVRNESSRANIETLFGPDLTVSVNLDAALALGDAAERWIPVPSPSEPDRSSNEPVNIGIHVHRLSGEVVDQRHVEIVSQLVRHSHPERDANVFFIHDQKRDGRLPEGAGEAEEFFRSQFPDIQAFPYRGVTDLIRTLNRLDVLLTSKLHVGIVSRALGVPVLATGHHPKISRFYESIGELDTVGPSGDYVPDGVPKRVVEAVGSAERRRIPLRPEASESALANREAVMSFVRKVWEGNEKADT